MARVKILKKLPKQKKIKTKTIIKQAPQPEVNKFKDDYFKFYDDIKHSSHQRYDW